MIPRTDFSERRPWDAKTWLIVLCLVALIGLIYARLNPAADPLACYTDGVRNQLREPQSAIFDGVRLTDTGATGWVNAKNGIGGYTGRRLFTVDGGCNGTVTILPAQGDLLSVR